MLKLLYSSIIFSILNSRSSSYSVSLINNIELLRRKILEESYELISESLGPCLDKGRLIEESCDLIYHVAVYLISFGISYCSLIRELSRRFGSKSKAVILSNKSRPD
ncbi:phosphoribosyl-ATP diphosphatase [Candidatus Vidania fulgoroideorum]